MNGIRVLVAVCFFTLSASLAPAQSAPPWPHERSDIAPSARVTWGRLENGLRYAILPNRTPEKLVSLRLLVLTGSLHERDDERGYAHFVEHMAFNGTRNFPAGELVKFLQRGGAAFGPHVNAQTNETHTLYKLDLPDATPAALAHGLRVLRDYADGILFEKAEVERERGVLLSEMRSRRSVAATRMEALRQFLFPRTLLAERNPIGTETAVQKTTPAALRAFYDAGYRPERMVLIVAGDCAREEAEAALRAQFAALVSRGSPRPEPAIGRVPDQKGLRAAFHGSLQDGVQIELMCVRPCDDEPDSEAGRRQRLHLELAQSMIAQRLRRLAETRSDVIAGSAVRSDVIAGRFVVKTVAVAGNAKEWSALLGLAEQEARRAVEQGFDPTELATMKDNLRARLRNEAALADTVASPALVEALVSSVEDGRVFVSPSDRLDVRLANLDAATVEDCRSAWRTEWERGAMWVFVSASPKLLNLPAEKIVAAYEKSRATPVAAASALAEVKFAYEDFGPSGIVTQRERVADFDVWQVRFANGVRLNLKRTAFEHGRVRLRLRFGTGRATEPKDRPGLGLWVGGLVLSGLKKHTDEELRQAMRGHEVRMHMAADGETCKFTASAAPGDLARLLQLAAACWTDSAWRPEGEVRTRRGLGDLYGSLRSSPDGVVLSSINAFHAGGDLRLALPERSVVEKHTFLELATWLKPMLASSPLEATLVGDFDVDTAIAEVAKTLGALPPLVEPTPAAADRPLKFPQPPDTRRYTYPAVAGRPTTLLLDWPVRDTLTMSERRRARLLAAVLEDRLRVQIREEKGATYAPDASLVYAEAYPGLASLRCRLDVAAKSAKKIAEQVVAIAGELARSGVTIEELDRARAQAAASARQQLSRNEYWLDALDDSQSRPGRLDELRTIERDYASATKADLDALAARYLMAKNLFRFFIEPKTAK